MSSAIKSDSEKSDGYNYARRINFCLSKAQNKLLGFKQAIQSSNSVFASEKRLLSS
jgi:hypothetical protein